MSFNKIKEFENKIAEFFNAPYAVAVDCCTHGIELCLRHQNISYINVPKRTYISVPFLAEKLKIQLNWKDENWQDYYYLTEHFTPIIDAAVLWKKDSYIPGTFMCFDDTTKISDKVTKKHFYNFKQNSFDVQLGVQASR